MLMMCWFYCADLGWFLYYAIGPVIFLASLFALKRGIANQRKGLRETAFIMMGGAAVKTFLADPFMRPFAIKAALCKVLPRLSPLGCGVDTGKGHQLVIFLGICCFIVAAYAIYEAFRKYMPDKKPKMVMPDEVHLDFWANLTFTTVLVMVAWQLAPWVGYLTVGCIPKLFIALTWQQLATIGLLFIIISFWKLESCVWQFKIEEKEKMKYMHSSWTPKDTIWMTVFVYLITLAMSYVAHDLMVRTHTKPEACKPGEVKENREWNVLDIDDLEVYR